MLNIVYTHASVVSVIFHYCMLQNKQSNRYSLYSMTLVVGCVICISNKGEYLDKECSYINSTKEVVSSF